MYRAIEFVHVLGIPKNVRDEFEHVSLNFSLTWIYCASSPSVVMMKKKQVLDQARKVTDERQQVDVSLASVKRKSPLKS